MKKILFPLAAVTLIAAPVAAQSIPAIAPIEGESVGGKSSGFVAAALIAGIIAIAVFAFTGDDDAPVSP
jgi:hypothetical protein